MQQIEASLHDLVKEYEIEAIHFTDIFGARRQLGKKRDEFFEKYTTIVSPLQMVCLSISNAKEDINRAMGIRTMNNEQIYFSLFWNVFSRILHHMNNNHIYHVYVEQEHDIGPSKYERVAQLLTRKLRFGIDQMCMQYPDKYFSICKYPQFFSKRAFFHSSVSDLAAYTTNKIQSKIDAGVPNHKILKEHSFLLRLVKKTFKYYRAMASEQLVDLIDKA